jgi:hypothetical protein
MSRRLAIALALAAAACSEPALDLGEDDGFSGDYTVVADVDPERIANVDVLFVIDNSGSMAEEQSALTDALAGDFVDVFERWFGVRPNMHVGVISTDVGAGPYLISGCALDGDNGDLQTRARKVTCIPPNGTFLVDIEDPELGEQGPRVVNYEGRMETAFECVAELGIDGCGFEQPLESMRRALDGSNPTNAGFVRDDALLAIVFLTDEDDCSALDTDVFDTAQNSIDDPLGPLSSFRCFEFGVQCSPDNPRQPGSRRTCIPRDDSPFITPVDDYVRFLKTVKHDPTRIVVAAITGPNSPVVIDADMNGNPKLGSVCESALGTADPAIRLSSFVGSFPGRGVLQPICTEEFLGDRLRSASSLIAGSATGGPCLVGPLRDVEPDIAGVQYDCRVYDAAWRGTPEETRTPIPSCDAPGAGLPCYELTVDDDVCGHTETGLAVDVIREAGTAVDDHVLVRCLTPTIE